MIRRWIAAIACVFIAAAIGYAVGKQEQRPPDFGQPLVASAPSGCGTVISAPSLGNHLPARLLLTNASPTYHHASNSKWQAVPCGQLTFNLAGGKLWKIRAQARSEFACLRGPCNVQLGLRTVTGPAATCTQLCQQETIIAAETYADFSLPKPTANPVIPNAKLSHQEYTLACNTGQTCTVIIGIDAKLHADTTQLLMDDLSIKVEVST